MNPRKRFRSSACQQLPRVNSSDKEQYNNDNITPKFNKISNNKQNDLDSITKKGILSRKIKPKPVSTVKNINSNKSKFKDPIKRKLVFNQYSRAQQDLNLRIETLFIACMLYDDLSETKLQEEQISDDEKFSIFFLSTKMQEIYRPYFNQISSYFNYTKSLKQYKEHELDTFLKLDCNINAKRGPFYQMYNFPTLYEQLKQNGRFKSYIFYMLETAIAQERLCTKFTWNQILSAIQMFIGNDTKKKDNSHYYKVLDCMKVFNNVKKFQSYRDPIFYKYSKSQHFYCSTLGDPKLPETRDKTEQKNSYQNQKQKQKINYYE